MPAKPTVQEMEEILKNAARCADGDAPECHEFTPGGVEVCAELPFWNGRPVTKVMLKEWEAIVNVQKNEKV